MFGGEMMVVAFLAGMFTGVVFLSIYLKILADRAWIIKHRGKSLHDHMCGK